MREWVDVSMVLGSGVYALLRQGTIVYIGQSREMVKRVYTHSQRRQVWGAKAKPPIRFDELWVQPCAPEELDRVEIELIALHKPRYNIAHAKRPAGPFVLTHNGITLEFNPSPGGRDAHAT